MSSDSEEEFLQRQRQRQRTHAMAAVNNHRNLIYSQKLLIDKLSKRTDAHMKLLGILKTMTEKHVLNRQAGRQISKSNQKADQEQVDEAGSVKKGIAE